jgi:hypothetical protein
MQAEEISLQVIHPDAAGIDIGNETHYVAVPPVRDSQPVRRFGCTTAELKDMAVWLSTPALPLGPGIMSTLFNRNCWCSRNRYLTSVGTLLI